MIWKYWLLMAAVMSLGGSRGHRTCMWLAAIFALGAGIASLLPPV